MHCFALDSTRTLQEREREKEKDAQCVLFRFAHSSRAKIYAVHQLHVDGFLSSEMRIAIAEEMGGICGRHRAKIDSEEPELEGTIQSQDSGVGSFQRAGFAGEGGRIQVAGHIFQSKGLHG